MKRSKRATLSDFLYELKFRRPYPGVDGVGILEPQQITILGRLVRLSKIETTIRTFQENGANTSLPLTLAFRLYPGRASKWLLLQYDLREKEELSPQQIDALLDTLDLWGLWSNIPPNLRPNEDN